MASMPDCFEAALLQLSHFSDSEPEQGNFRVDDTLILCIASSKLYNGILTHLTDPYHSPSDSIPVTLQDLLQCRRIVHTKAVVLVCNIVVPSQSRFGSSGSFILVRMKKVKRQR